MLANTVGFAALVAPLQIVAGDLQGLAVLDQQPLKLAAIEGHWQTGRGVSFVLFALPDQAAETNRWAVAIPRL